jgi:hypothetical protein
MEKLIGYTAMLAGVIGVVTLRVLSIDLTEGQSLVAYWHEWAISASLLFLGAFLMGRKG